MSKQSTGDSTGSDDQWLLRLAEAAADTESGDLPAPERAEAATQSDRDLALLAALAGKRPEERPECPFGAGDRWGGFRIQSLLGSDRAGWLFQAVENTTGQTRHLWLVQDRPPQFPRDDAQRASSTDSSEQQQRIGSELTHPPGLHAASTPTSNPSEPRPSIPLTTLEHANVQPILGAARHDRYFGMWSAVPPGESLRERIAREGTFDPTEAARIALQILRAFEALQQSGASPGPLTPATTFIDSTNRVRIPGVDFEEPIPWESMTWTEPRAVSAAGPPVTSEVSPSRGQLHLRALGGLLLFLTTGSRVHSDGGVVLSADFVIGSDPSRQLPPDFRAAVAQALLTGAPGGYTRPSELRDDLEKFLARRPYVRDARTTALTVAAAALVALVIIALVVWRSSSPFSGRPPTPLVVHWSEDANGSSRSQQNGLVRAYLEHSLPIGIVSRTSRAGESLRVFDLQLTPASTAGDGAQLLLYRNGQELERRSLSPALGPAVLLATRNWLAEAIGWPRSVEPVAGAAPPQSSDIFLEALDHLVRGTDLDPSLFDRAVGRPSSFEVFSAGEVDTQLLLARRTLFAHPDATLDLLDSLSFAAPAPAHERRAAIYRALALGDWTTTLELLDPSGGLSADEWSLRFAALRAAGSFRAASDELIEILSANEDLERLPTRFRYQAAQLEAALGHHDSAARFLASLQAPPVEARALSWTIRSRLLQARLAFLRAPSELQLSLLQDSFRSTDPSTALAQESALLHAALLTETGREADALDVLLAANERSPSLDLLAAATHLRWRAADQEGARTTAQRALEAPGTQPAAVQLAALLCAMGQSALAEQMFARAQPPSIRTAEARVVDLRIAAERAACQSDSELAQRLILDAQQPSYSHRSPAAVVRLEHPYERRLAAMTRLLEQSEELVVYDREWILQPGLLRDTFTDLSADLDRKELAARLSPARLEFFEQLIAGYESTQ